MLSSYGKTLLMLREEDSACRLLPAQASSGYARIEYGNFAGRVTFSAQNLSPNCEYRCFVYASGAMPQYVCRLKADKRGKGSGYGEFSFNNMKNCGQIAAVIVYVGEDAHLVLCGYKGVGAQNWREDVKYVALSGRAPKKETEIYTEKKAPAAEPVAVQSATVQAVPVKTETVQTESAQSESVQSAMEEGTGTYFDTVREYFDEIFADYDETEDTMREMIPNSRWQKVQYNGNDGYCLVGLILDYETNEPLYICYGVPGENTASLPETLQSYCQWLPAASSGDGYWTMYQDARTGETIVV